MRSRPFIDQRARKIRKKQANLPKQYINRFKDDNEMLEINKLQCLSDRTRKVALIKGAGLIKCTSENCNLVPKLQLDTH